MNRTNIRHLLFIAMLFFISVAQAQTVSINQGGHLESYAIPGFETMYELTVSYGTVSRVDWTVTGGSFSSTTTQKYLTKYTNEPVSVYWENISFLDGYTGTLKAEVIVDGEIITKTFKQKIRTLKDVTPPNLYATPSSSIPMGKTSVAVRFTKEFFYPGTPVNGSGRLPVDKFEWTLPAGWVTTSGQSGTFVSTNSSLSVKADNIVSGTIKVRGINREAPIDDRSNYASLTVSRNNTLSLPFKSVPPSVSWGVQTCVFEAELLSGNCTYEWSVPAGWKINGGSNTYSAVNANKINVTTSLCPTDGKVRVRVKNGAAVSEWLTVLYGGVVTPGINTGTYYQFEYGTPSIDLPAANISNIQWTVTNGVISSGQGTNTPKIMFTQSGDVTIEATFTLNGCGTQKLSKKITVQPCRYSIAGAAVVCSTTRQTYSVSNVTIPLEVQLSWNVGDKLSLYSGQGTAAATVQAAVGKWGNQAITMTIKYGNLAQVKSKTVYVSYPVVTGVSGSSTLRRNETGNFSAAPYFASDVADYVWTVSPSTGVTQSPYRNTNMISFSQEGSYSVSCRAYTSGCGASGSAATFIVSVYGTYRVSSSGNKTVTIVENKLNDGGMTEKPMNTSSTGSKNTSGTVLYKLFDAIGGRIVAEGNFPSEGGTLDFSAQVSGAYVLTLQMPDGIVETHKIMLQ